VTGEKKKNPSGCRLGLVETKNDLALWEKGPTLRQVGPSVQRKKRRGRNQLKRVNGRSARPESGNYLVVRDQGDRGRDGGDGDCFIRPGSRRKTTREKGGKGEKKREKLWRGVEKEKAPKRQPGAGSNSHQFRSCPTPK